LSLSEADCQPPWRWESGSIPEMSLIASGRGRGLEGEPSGRSVVPRATGETRRCLRGSGLPARAGDEKHSAQRTLRLRRPTHTRGATSRGETRAPQGCTSGHGVSVDRALRTQRQRRPGHSRRPSCKERAERAPQRDEDDVLGLVVRSAVARLGGGPTIQNILRNSIHWFPSRGARQPLDLDSRAG
jgi:hypothetical protein